MIPGVDVSHSVVAQLVSHMQSDLSLVTQNQPLLF